MKDYSTPGIYFSENDNVYLPAGAGVSSGLIIGPTELGPAFLPVKTTSPTAWTTLFGPSTPNQYTALTALNYHAYADSLYTVRILGVSNPDNSPLYPGAAIATLRSITGKTLLMIGIYADDLSTIDPESIRLMPDLAGSYRAIYIQGALYQLNGLRKSYNDKPNPNSPFLIYLDEDIEKAYVSYNNCNPADVNAAGYVSLYTENTQFSFSNASSPNFKGFDNKDLFKFHTISDGNASNQKIYITLQNFNSDQEFDVVIYDWHNREKIIENYARVNLNPDSANYIGKAIGDINYEYNALNNKIIEEGNYPSMSSLVYLSIDSYVEMGQAYKDHNYPYMTEYQNLPLFNEIADDDKRYNDMGVLDITDVYEDYISDQKWSVTEFDISPKTIMNNPDGIPYNADGDAFETRLKTPAQYEAFGLGGMMSGGYNATSPYSVLDPVNMGNIGGLDMTSPGVTLAYGYALALVQDRYMYDVNLLTTPGVISTVGAGGDINKIIKSWIDNDQRQDVFYIKDQVAINAPAKANAAASNAANDSYSAAYHSWGKLNDGGKIRWCPPSVDIMSVYAFSDNSAGAQSAPAGLSRGGVKFSKLYDYINTAEKKLLLDNRVNPIVKLGTEGIFVMGNRTQLKDETKALSRINVRRLMISLKKQILHFSKYYMYEQPKISLLNRWENQIKQVLDTAAENGGILPDYKVLVSTDEADILRGIMRGQIWIKPIRSIEYVILEFNLEGPNVDFNEA